MANDLKPLQLVRELYDQRLNIFSERVLNNPPALRRRWRLARATGKLLKPLLRFESLFSLQQRMALELIGSQSLNLETMEALFPFHLALKKYIENVISCAEKRDRPLVWLEWCVSTDLIYAFEAQPLCTEGLVAVLLILNPEANLSLIDVGEAAGVPVEYCSGSKNAVGAALANQLPRPDCIVTSSHPCDSIVSSYQSLEYLAQVPIFRLDTPYYDDERALDYYAEEVRRLISFLEEQFQRKLDYDRLRQVLTEVNTTNQLLMEMNEMYQARPCPGSVLSTILAWVTRVIGLGTPEMTEVARRLHALTKKRVKEGRGTVKKERVRVIWFDVPVAFYPLVIWMEETFGAVIVTDVVSYLHTPEIDTSNEQTMIRGLAASYMNLPMARQFHGPIEFYLRDLARICETYQGDCFIFAGHNGCKHAWASTRLLKEYMKQINMPLLILSSDIFDRRVTHEDKLKAQIEEFFISNRLV